MSVVDKLPALMENWQEIYEEGEPHLKVSGNLVEQASELPAHIGYYGEVYKEIYNIRKRLDAEIRRKRGELFRYYTEKYPRALSTRDVDQYINSDNDFCVLDNKLHDVEYWEGRFEALIKGFEVKNWQTSNVTKLYIAGIEDIEI